MVFPLIILGKVIAFISYLFNIGSGGTWPGEVALMFNKNLLSFFFASLSHGVILISGTNGKTTTAKMIKMVLEKNGYKVIHNKSGANLLNGLVSAFINEASWKGKIKADFGVFEVDENSLPLIISKIKYQRSKIQIKNQKLIIILLNLFRDQLDRYGEVDVIAEKWQKALRHSFGQAHDHKNTTLILNADDPLTAYLGVGLKSKVIYFGLEEVSDYKKKLEHATDFIFCLACGSRLKYEKIYYSHLGKWSCKRCGLKRPKPDIVSFISPLPGIYNRYNTQAAAATLLTLGIKEDAIKAQVTDFNPAFGRQEEFTFHGKKIKIFLSKNPTGFNESLRTVISLGAKHILFVLNDRIPDGRDVSWIWDVDIEEFLDDSMKIFVSGDRAYDMGLRIKYSNSSKFQISNFKFQIEQNLKKAINLCIKQTSKSETLYILPTYSAMLEVRKIIKGRKIL